MGLLVVGPAVIAIDTSIAGAARARSTRSPSSATALGNVGPGFGVTGPMGSFAPFSDASKIVLVGLMWLGRLEVVPIVVLFTRPYWRRSARR